MEKKNQDVLKNEILSLKSQLEESKQGLLAAARLSNQLENSKHNIASLKEEGKVCPILNSYHIRCFIYYTKDAY